MLNLERATGLVIRGTDFSETSRISTLWTREFGKIRALAKGGRRLRSNFDSAFDLLNVCHVVFIRKAGGLDLLTEARLEERFPALRGELNALYAGYYVAELLDATQDYDPHPVLFDASLAMLRTIADTGTDRLGAVSAFELVWLRELGYSPRLTACAACDRDLLSDAPARLGFSPGGGVVCDACLGTTRDHRPLSLAAWPALRELNEGRTELAANVRREVRGHLSQTVSFVLGRRPRLAGYIDGTGP